MAQISLFQMKYDSLLNSKKWPCDSVKRMFGEILMVKRISVGYTFFNYGSRSTVQSHQLCRMEEVLSKAPRWFSD